MGQFDKARQVEYSKNIATRAGKWLLDVVKKPLETIGSVQEMTGKLTGYKILAHDKAARADIAKRAAAGDVSVTEADIRAQMTRSAAGTPDFTHGGKQKRLLNNLFFFSNVNIQGARAGLASFAKDHTAWTTKFLLHSMPWRIVTALASEERLSWAVNELFGGTPPAWLANYAKFLDESMKYIPEDHRARQFVHPLPVRSKAPEYFDELKDEDGNPIEYQDYRQLYTRIPGDYTTQAANAATYYLAKAKIQADKAKEKGTKGPGVWNTVMDVGGEATELLPVGAPALNPMLQVVAAWVSFMQGGQPRDAFTGRDIVPANVQKMHKGRQVGQMALWTVDKAGPFSGIYRVYDPNENPVKEEKRKWKEDLRKNPSLDIPEPIDDRPEIEKFMSYPVVGPVLKAFLGMSNYGIKEAKREKEAGKKAEKVERTLRRLKGGAEAVDDVRK